MDPRDLKHHLAAILAADAAGYSRLMASDEHATLTTLDVARAAFRSQIEAHHGRVVDMAGDSVLAVFETAAGAVTAALAVQASINAQADAAPDDRRMRFRIGVHLGDVIEKADGTVYGDGVNIAARLQALAEPGGITISDSVRGAVRGKVAASFEDRGEQAVKNMAEPVRAFAARPEGAAPVAADSPRAAVDAIDLPLPDKPSIAVLPFVNMSGDPEQEYFTDGITEDIITALSRFHSLFVIARNSSFSYKGSSPDIRRVGKELGVRYVLEGSIRKSAARIRVTGQLIDTFTGNHLWAEKYDRVLEDIFEVQEELAYGIVAAIAPHIEVAEREKVRRRRPESLSAYERAVSALARFWDGYLNADVALRNEALAEAQAALAIDPRSSLALEAVAWGQLFHVLLGTTPDLAAAWQSGIAAATRALEIDPGNCEAHAAKAYLLSFAPDKRLAAEDLRHGRRAYELNPNSTRALSALAHGELCTGLADESIVHIHEAMRLNPRDPGRSSSHLQLSMGYLVTGDYGRGVEHAKLGISEAPGVAQLHGYLAMNLVGTGDLSAARDACAEARGLGPTWVERILAGRSALRKPEHLRRATTFMRIAAGLENPDVADALR